MADFFAFFVVLFLCFILASSFFLAYVHSRMSVSGNEESWERFAASTKRKFL